MPTTKDCVFYELSLRNKAIAPGELARARIIQEELGQAGIQRSLSSILVERELATREAVTKVWDEASKYWIRCKDCKKQTPLSMTDLSGGIHCKNCQARITYSYERIPEEDLTRAAKSDWKAPDSRASSSTPSSHRGTPDPPPTNVSEPTGGTQAAPALTASGNEADQRGSAIVPRIDPSTRPFIELAKEELESRRDVTKFRPRELLGVSPFGRLYLVEERPRASVIKVFDRTLTKDKERVKAWVDYMRKVQDLPGAVTVKPVQLFREGLTSYLLRPFLGQKSDSLRARIVAGDVSLASPGGVQAVLQSILQALHEFHSAQIVHGNLRPENVVLAENGVVLVDPGLQLLLEGLPPGERVLRLFDRASSLAPEVALGAASSFSSDIFAVGRILEEMLPKSEPASVKSQGGPRDWKLLRGLAATLTAENSSKRPESAAETLRWLETAGRKSPGRRILSGRGAHKAILLGLKRLRPQMAAPAALVLVVVILIFASIGWYRGLRAFSDPARADQAVAQIVTDELMEICLWTESPLTSRPEAEKRWHQLETVYRGSPFETRVKESSAKALQRFDQIPERVASLLLKARTYADAKNWIRAVEMLLQVEVQVNATEEVRVLRARVLEGLLRDEGMVLVPAGPKRTDDRPSSAFLADARPECRGEAAEWARLTAVTGIEFSDAHLLAASQGKRLPTEEEWDRLARLAAEKSSSWAAPYAERITFVPGLFEWVVESSEDQLSRQGYGTCRGGGRNGVPPTHPLRRKKAAGYGDVGVRFVKDLGAAPF